MDLIHDLPTDYMIKILLKINALWLVYCTTIEDEYKRFGNEDSIVIIAEWKLPIFKKVVWYSINKDLSTFQALNFQKKN